MRSCLAASLVWVLFGVGCSDDPCEGVTGTCIAIEEGASAESVQTTFITVPEGATIAFAAGRFEFAAELSLDVDGVTIKGAGIDATTLSFKGQTEGAQGVLVTADRFTLTDLAIEDTQGDALKVLGAAGVTIQRTRVEWTGGPAETNGAYGLYPVQCSDVLIEDSVAVGASDAGVYVGQSDRIIVRRNRVLLNVAGIEIENSTNADVYENTATTNTGGILVFNLPDLEVANGAKTRVFDNTIFENNTDNFAPAGNIVGLVPKGTGIAILAAHQVEIFGNDVRDHLTVNIGLISYVPTMKPVTDRRYDQYPTSLWIHDNTLAGVSDQPTGELGALLILGLGELHGAPYIVPDIMWDGVRDPARSGGGDYAGADRICIQRNGDADFLDLHYPTDDAVVPVEDLAPHDCAHPALPDVQLSAP
ncbi:MAG: right-handed parallel beta-helix repeat-containing protein [Deltaproteobacteria bacterium]|nr:right-handed parallel beta-helix repeat-containing protein [Deltaproteobacteria bacterium]